MRVFGIAAAETVGSCTTLTVLRAAWRARRTWVSCSTCGNAAVRKNQAARQTEGDSGSAQIVQHCSCVCSRYDLVRVVRSKCIILL